tara:strand:- start:397 stop:501 length:105 start_codon:yes stop_codon:yes gene_type:complete
MILILYIKNILTKFSQRMFANFIPKALASIQSDE